MNPVSPVIAEEFVSSEVQIAKDQPEYRTLPSIIRADNQIRLSRWKLTDQEREAVAAGADLFLFVWAAFQPPVLLEVTGCQRDLMATAQFMWLVDPPVRCFDCGKFVVEWIRVVRADRIPIPAGVIASGGLQPICQDCANPEEWQRFPMERSGA